MASWLAVMACAPDGPATDGPATDRPAPAASRTASVALRTGATLHYLEQGPADGEPVVLLHGYTDSSSSYARLLPLLPTSWRVLVPDQRGHGRSSKTMASHTVADFAADVVAFLDALRIERVTLVGHSMGSMVAQLLAIDHPQRIARLVLIGSMTTGDNPATRSLAAEVRKIATTVDPAFVREFQRSNVAVPVPDAFLDRIVADSLTVPARVWHDALDDIMRLETTAKLGAIRAPTLILWGERDPFFPRADQETLDRLIPDSTLRIMPEVAHCPTWERPEQVVAELASFFRRPVRDGDRASNR